jgi:molybdenum cofactor synthesis domain-containing protein
MDRQGAAAGVIIGNEVLSAKVEDLNGVLLARRLRDHGIPLRLIATVPDEIDPIVNGIVQARAVAEHVFTSGGIGPTHDDVTVRAVALALSRRVVRMPELAELVERHYRGQPPLEALRLADAPAGTQLIWREGIWYPALQCEKIYLLPGVPQLFELQLETILSRLKGAPIHLRALYLSLDEPEIAHVLDRIAISMPQATIGSYPQFDRSVGYRVKVTVENPELSVVERIVARLQTELPAGAILRIE